MGLVAEYGVQRTGGWLMFPGNLTVYYYEKDSGREDDKGYWRAITLLDKGDLRGGVAVIGCC